MPVIWNSLLLLFVRGVVRLSTVLLLILEIDDLVVMILFLEIHVFLESLSSFKLSTDLVLFIDLEVLLGVLLSSIVILFLAVGVLFLDLGVLLRLGGELMISSLFLGGVEITSSFILVLVTEEWRLNWVLIVEFFGEFKIFFFSGDITGKIDSSSSLLLLLLLLLVFFL